MQTRLKRSNCPRIDIKIIFEHPIVHLLSVIGLCFQSINFTSMKLHDNCGWNFYCWPQRHWGIYLNLKSLLAAKRHCEIYLSVQLYILKLSMIKLCFQSMILCPWICTVCRDCWHSGHSDMLWNCWTLPMNETDIKSTSEWRTDIELTSLWSLLTMGPRPVFPVF